MAMNADHRNMAGGTYDVLADIERGGNAHGFDGHIDPVLCLRHDLLHRVFFRRVDDIRGAEFFCDFQPVAIRVDHIDLRGRIELRGKQGGQAYGARTDYSDGIPGFYLAVEHADLIGRGQDIAQHHERFLVDTRRDRVKTVVGMGDAHVFGLGAVDQMSEYPPAIFAMGIDTFLAVLAGAVGGDAGDEHMIAFFEISHRRAHFLHYTHAFVPEGRARFYIGYFSLEDAQVGTADSGAGYADEGVGGFGELWHRHFFELHLTRPAIDQCFHFCFHDQTI